MLYVVNDLIAYIPPEQKTVRSRLCASDVVDVHQEEEEGF